MNRQNKNVIMIFSIAMVLRLALFLAIGSWRSDIFEKRILKSDSIRYNQIALNLLNHGVFSSSAVPPYQADIFTTPSYPFFLAAAYIVSNYKPVTAILLQILAASAVCLLVYKIGQELFREKVALMAALFAAFEYSSIFYSNTLFSETVFTFFFTIQIFFLLRFLKTSFKKWLIWSAIFLGLATLTRPVSLYFFVFPAGLFIVHFRKHWRKGLLTSAVFISVFLLTLLPWMIRNYKVSGKFLVSSAQLEVLDWNFYDILEFLKIKKYAPSEEEAISEPNPSSPDTSKGRSAVGALGSQFKGYLKGTASFFLTTGSSVFPRILGLPYNEMENEILSKKPVEMVEFIVRNKNPLELFIFFFSIGFLLFLYSTIWPGFYAATKEHRAGAFLLLCIIFYFAFASAPFTTTERYRLPIMPVVILLSCRGFFLIQEAINSRRKNRIVKQKR
jgi:4-amino-4-deoxy-L-arabinose transferase-like glycosyltransferase